MNIEPILKWWRLRRVRLILLSAHLTVAKTRPPNVIFILGDDLGYPVRFRIIWLRPV